MAAAGYEIRIRGRLSEAMQTAFEEFEVSTEPVETILHGQVLDQAALHGLLDRIASLGLELVEVRRLAGEPPRASSGRACSPAAGETRSPTSHPNTISKYNPRVFRQLICLPRTGVPMALQPVLGCRQYRILPSNVPNGGSSISSVALAGRREPNDEASGTRGPGRVVAAH